MKKFLPLLFVAIFSILVATPIVPSIVRAETSNETTEERIEKTLDSRIQKYTQDHPSKLTAAQIAKLKQTCKPAQDKTKGFTEVAVNKGDQRQKLYEASVTRLTDMSKKIEVYNAKADSAKKINTAELNTQIAELRTKVAKFKTDISTYQVALNDLSSLNCQELTETFKSALEAVRENQASLKTTSTEINTLLNDKIKPELKGLKVSFELAGANQSTDKEEKTEGTQ